MAYANSGMPESLTAGTTYKFSQGWTDYPANAGWTAGIYIAGAAVTRAPITGTPNGSYFDFVLSAAALASFPSGNYQWQIIVAKAGESYIAASGVLRVLPNVAQATAGSLLTWAERTLPIVEAAIEGRLTADVQSYQINGRAVTKIPIGELLNLRAKCVGIIRQEQHPGEFITNVQTNFKRPD